MRKKDAFSPPFSAYHIDKVIYVSTRVMWKPCKLENSYINYKKTNKWKKPQTKKNKAQETSISSGEQTTLTPSIYAVSRPLCV